MYPRRVNAGTDASFVVSLVYTFTSKENTSLWYFVAKIVLGGTDGIN